MGSVVTDLEHGSFCSVRLLAASVHIDLAGFCVSLFILNQTDPARPVAIQSIDSSMAASIF